jgi:hypothetical protein
VLLFDRDSWPHHRRLACTSALATTASVLWYVWEWVAAGERPRGSSLVGFVYGAGAAMLIFYALWYPISRRLFGFRATRLQYPLRPPPPPHPPGAAYHRLRWHIWVGLLVFPLAVMHSGLWPRQSFAGFVAPALPVWLFLVLLFVLASGVFGLVVQQFVPRALFDRVPDETPPREVRRLRRELLVEAELLVWVALGYPPSRHGKGRDLRWKPSGRRLAPEVAGRVHRGTGRGALALLPELRGEPPAEEPTADERALWEFFRTVVRPYLANWVCRGPLLYPSEASGRFGRMKKGWRPKPSGWFRQLIIRLRGQRDGDGKVSESTHPRATALLTALEIICQRRRQLERQVRLHRWLNWWVRAHYVLSASLLGLLLWHAATAMRFW